MSSFIDNSTFMDAVVEQAPYGWVQRTITSVLEIFLIFIYISYLRRYKRYLRVMHLSSPRHLSTKPADKILHKWRRLSHIFTIITLCTYCIQGGNICLNSWSVYSTPLSCDIYQKFSVWFYHLGKFSLYMVLVLRIKVVFNASRFHFFVTYMVRVLYVLLAIYLIGATIGDFVFISASKIYTNREQNIFYCSSDGLVLWGLLSKYVLFYFIMYCIDEKI